jgi:hypothetical protein
MNAEEGNKSKGKNQKTSSYNVSAYLTFEFLLLAC